MKQFAKKHKKLLIILSTILILLVGLYNYLVYTTNPFISKWRTIYIETAMTTNSHQWLATLFLPQSLIDEVMNDRVKQEELQKELESSWNEDTFEITSANRTNTLETTKKETEETTKKTIEESF